MSPHLFFAGEHTDVDYFGSTHGAHFSGQRAAYEIIDAWYKEKELNKTPTKTTTPKAKTKLKMDDKNSVTEKAVEQKQASNSPTISVSILWLSVSIVISCLSL